MFKRRMVRGRRRMSRKVTVGRARAVAIAVLSDVKMFRGQQQPGRNAQGHERCEQARPEHAAHRSDYPVTQKASQMRRSACPGMVSDRRKAPAQPNAASRPVLLVIPAAIPAAPPQ